MASSRPGECCVPDWIRLAYRGVSTKDGKPVGVIDAEDQHFILVLAPRSKEYKIPKSSIEVFDGFKVQLGITADELRRYLL
jgi:hypothetical protein